MTLLFNELKKKLEEFFEIIKYINEYNEIVPDLFHF